MGNGGGALLWNWMLLDERRLFSSSIAWRIAIHLGRASRQHYLMKGSARPWGWCMHNVNVEQGGHQFGNGASGAGLTLAASTGAHRVKVHLSQPFSHICPFDTALLFQALHAVGNAVQPAAPSLVDKRRSSVSMNMAKSSAMQMVSAVLDDTQDVFV